jgi:hypothetical protein
LGQHFDPSSIPEFSIIRIPYQFGADPPLSKLFVVLGHKTDGFGTSYAVCIKTTSNVDLYSDQRKRKGCVCYKAGELECFPAELTFVEPDNQFPISHVDIIAANRNGKFENHLLPDDFQERLCVAIKSSITLSVRQKQRLAEFVNCP